jgi:hypothetical protein
MNDADLNKAAQILLGHTPVEHKLTTEPMGYIRCACNKKQIHESEVTSHWSGLCNARDTICRECAQMMPKHALIVCLVCKEVIGRMAPGVLYSGFRVEPRKIYHTARCLKCSDSASTSIVEAEWYMRKKRS